MVGCEWLTYIIYLKFIKNFDIIYIESEKEINLAIKRVKSLSHVVREQLERAKAGLG